MIKTPTSKNFRKVVPLILVVLAALFFLNSCKKHNNKRFVQYSNTTKINFNCETRCLDFSAKYYRVGLRLIQLNNHSYLIKQFIINV